MGVLIFKGAQDVYGQRGRSGPASLQGMMVETATFQPACVQGRVRRTGFAIERDPTSRASLTFDAYHCSANL